MTSPLNLIYLKDFAFTLYHLAAVVELTFKISACHFKAFRILFKKNVYSRDSLGLHPVSWVYKHPGITLDHTKICSVQGSNLRPVAQTIAQSLCLTISSLYDCVL